MDTLAYSSTIAADLLGNDERCSSKRGPHRLALITKSRCRGLQLLHDAMRPTTTTPPFLRRCAAW